MLHTVPRSRRGKTTDEEPEPLSLRMPKPLLAQLRAIAQREDRTLTAQIVRVLRGWAAAKDSGQAEAGRDPKP